jgi:endonuclease YncB( thermonuclease family)
VVAALVVTMAACTSTPADTGGGDQPATPGEGAEARLLGVEDGDTAIFEMDGMRTPVRLLGINAPEVGECMHDEAATALVQALEGHEIIVEAHGLDQFERTLAYVWADGLSVNLELVVAGLAIATTAEADEELGDELLSAEQQSFEAGSGLWDGCDSAGSSALELEVDTSGHDPPGPDEEALEEEVVTLANLGTAPVELGGWVLRDESSAHRYRFAPGSTLAPGEELEIASSDVGWDPGDSPVWSNGGDMALLLDPDGGVVSRARYGPS